MTYTVGYFVGSLASNSINRRLAKALVRAAPEDLNMVEINYSDLPLYNRDFDESYPPEGLALKNTIAKVDAVLFVTPEYNRSIPGALKNAIDWASRPHGKNSFANKPVATIGTSGSPLSSAVGQQHLKNILAFLNAPSMAQPEGYIRNTEGLITQDGDVTNETTKEFLKTWMTAFTTHIQQHTPKTAA